MKNKIKTHKGTKKRIKISGSGKIMRQQRQNRMQRFARGTNSKSKNTDTKALEISDAEKKRVKRLLLK